MASELEKGDYDVQYPQFGWLFIIHTAVFRGCELDGLRCVFASIPAVSELLVVYLLYRYPLDEATQVRLREQPPARDAG